MKHSCLSAAALALTLTWSASAGEKTGNGSSHVEPLFFNAREDARRIVEEIAPDSIDFLEIDASFKSWLKVPLHLYTLQYYTRNMALEFQEAPCLEPEGPRDACFDNRNRKAPKMIVSREANADTTPDQAVAMVIHEAAHFTGDMNHEFLSAMGTQLAATGKLFRSRLLKLKRTLMTDKACEKRVGAGSRAYFFLRGYDPYGYLFRISGIDVQAGKLYLEWYSGCYGIRGICSRTGLDVPAVLTCESSGDAHFCTANSVTYRFGEDSERKFDNSIRVSLGEDTSSTLGGRSLAVRVKNYYARKAPIDGIFEQGCSRVD